MKSLTYLSRGYAVGLSMAAMAIFSTFGCKDILDVGAPVTSLNKENVYTSDLTAIQVTTGIYASLSQNNMDGGGVGPVAIFSGLAADELVAFNNPRGYGSYFSNNLRPTENGPWPSFYSYLFRANAALEGLENSTSLSPSVRQQLLGESKFIRAYMLFYLVNLYGDCPLPLTTDTKSNILLPRAPKEQVYQQIINDLRDAMGLMGNDFLDGSLRTTTERTRPNKWAAAALLARAYLYHKDYAEAEATANSVIGENKFELLPNINDVFKKNSRETIWALQPVYANSREGYNSGEGRFFILPSTGPSGTYPFYLSDHAMNNFEYGDLRKSNWTNRMTTANGSTYNYAFKYKASVAQSNVTEYSIVLRIGEQYLIRAEARARQEGQAKVAGAVEDLNRLRGRARAIATGPGDNPIPAIEPGISRASLLSAIERERFSELFTEGGHRWLDLKRTTGASNPALTRADEVMPDICRTKGGTWSPNWKLWPIPQDDILRNPNMVGQQNPGYN